jgi:TPR repeat protein
VQNEVGLLYLSGRLGIRDATAAAGWFSRSAARGYAKAANNLGTLYEKGLGVPKNYSRAGRYYAQAANAGVPAAATALGRLYAQALGTKQDLPKAWALFSLAVERGDNNAKTFLGELTSQITEKQMAEGRGILAEFKSDKKGQTKEATSTDKTGNAATAPKKDEPKKK